MLRGVALAAVVALALTSCDGSGGEPNAARSPRSTPTTGTGLVIGLVGSMSGSESWRGTDAFEGADLGVSILNRGAGRGEATFELVTLDDEGDPERATQLIEELAASERTVGIIHAGPSEALPPADDALAIAGIPGLLIYGDLYSSRLLRSHLFQMSPPSLWQSRRIASYLGSDRDYDVIGLVAERSLTGDGAVASLKVAVDDTRGLRTLVRRYRGPEDLPGALADLRKARVEAIVFQGGPGRFRDLLGDLNEMDATYRGTSAARWASLSPGRRRNRNRRAWRPQVVTFAEGMGPQAGRDLPPGTIASESYVRGADYMPVPSFRGFSAAFEDWWAMAPLGAELRAYEAVQMIGWAARSAEPDQDLALVLEELDGRRFGGLDIILGPDDHVSIGETTIGLWVVPGAKDDIRESPQRLAEMPWVPLARAFSTGGRRTDVLPRDWRYLFRNAPPVEAPAPPFIRMRFGVTTPRRDPLH